MNEGEEHFSEFTVTQMHHPWQVSPLFESEDIRSLSLPLKATHCCPKPPERHQTWDKTSWRNRRELGVSAPFSGETETQNFKTAASLWNIHLCLSWSSCHSSNKVPSFLVWTESDAFTTDARWEVWGCDIRKDEDWVVADSDPEGRKSNQTTPAETKQFVCRFIPGLHTVTVKKRQNLRGPFALCDEYRA